MNKSWTLHVERFGRIEECDIRVSPMLCFVGENNSGKSYLMSLLWGIITIGKNLFPKVPSDAKAYRVCENWLKNQIGNDTQVNRENIDNYLAWFNEILSANRRTLTKAIFHQELDIGKIELRNYCRDEPLKLLWSNSHVRYVGTRRAVKLPIPEEITRQQLLCMNIFLCWNILMSEIAAPMFPPVIRGHRNGEPVYLPASRTGFMLTYPQLVEQSIQQTFASDYQEENRSTLTAPYIDFIQLITKFENKARLNKLESSTVEYIQSHMLHEDLTIRKELLPQFQYHPSGTEKSLPLYLASSLVSEISPVLLLFQSGIDFDSLIIEEPEAHLHPEFQQKMARLLIRLVNQKKQVWITTHSDTMLQHFNNMIKLYGNEHGMELMQKYGYDKLDILSPEDVSMYQFTAKPNGKTEISELSCNKYGFVAPTFNHAIDRIVEEVYAFQEETNV